MNNNTYICNDKYQYSNLTTYCSSPIHTSALPTTCTLPKYHALASNTAEQSMVI